MTNPLVEALKPCPFCGSTEIHLRPFGTVDCDFCEISLPSNVWNERTLSDFEQPSVIGPFKVTVSAGIPEDMIVVNPKITDGRYSADLIFKLPKPPEAG